MATLFPSRSGVGRVDAHLSDPESTVPEGRLRISSAVSVELLYRDFDLKVPPRVDCLLLFLGAHLQQILETYKKAVRLFSETREPAELLGRLRADWSLLLDAPTIVPYATFTFARGKVPPEVARFAGELSRRGIGRRFYPMRPLDSLTAADLGEGLSARSRRWRLVAWSRGVGGLYRIGRRAGVGRSYRYLRHKLHV